MVENQIMNQSAFEVARKYITYRYKRALVRKSNTTDEQIIASFECNNEEVKPGEFQQKSRGKHCTA